MEIFRYSRNAWGQTTLEGMSFDLFWGALGLSLTFVVVHAVIVAIKRRSSLKN